MPRLDAMDAMVRTVASSSAAAAAMDAIARPLIWQAYTFAPSITRFICGGAVLSHHSMTHESS